MQLAGNQPVTASRRLYDSVLRLLGAGEQDIAPDSERQKNTRTFAVIGFVALLAYGMTNLSAADARLQFQARIQLAEVLLLMVPSLWLAFYSRRPERAESALVGSGIVIFASNTLIGGLHGDAIYWSFVFPYLVFFLRGQQVGWLVGVLNSTLVPWLMFYSSTHWNLWHYDPQLCVYYGVAYLFNVLTAAHFNLLRSSFQQHLWEQVDANTREARRHLAALAFNATHDTATGLLNRQGIIEEIRTTLTDQVPGTGYLFVVSIQFHRVMELAGIVGMDQVNGSLARLAERLRQQIPDTVAIGRTRQDHLTLLLRSASDDPAIVAPIHAIDQLPGASIAGEFTIHDDFCFGVAIERFGVTDKEPDDLLRKAEQALLYGSNHRQRGQFYDAALAQHLLRHNLRYEKLRQAVLADALTLHYQPQVDLASAQVVGAEALVRWFDAEEGMIPPDAFIPIIESTGLLNHFSIWTIRQGMRDCASWQADLPGVTVSINLSADTLHDPLVVQALEDALASHAIDPALVIVELTESVMLKSPEMAMAMMRKIVDLGLHLSIDDYGAGFSSLTYVKQLPAHELKIDKSFISDLTRNAQDQAIVASTVELGHDFGLKVLAEGVEDAATMAMLRSLGCDLGQGGHYGKARPLESVKAGARKLAGAHQATDSTVTNEGAPR